MPNDLERLADLLVEKETVDGDEVYRLLGLPVPEHQSEAQAIAPGRAAAHSGAHRVPPLLRAGARRHGRTAPRRPRAAHNSRAPAAQPDQRPPDAQGRAPAHGRVTR